TLLQCNDGRARVLRGPAVDGTFGRSGGLIIMADQRGSDGYNTNAAILVLLGIVFIPIVLIHLLATIMEHLVPRRAMRPRPSHCTRPDQPNLVLRRRETQARPSASSASRLSRSR